MRYLLLLLLATPLIADEIFSDPPRIWKTECYRCRPLEEPLREIEENVVVDLRNPLYEGGILSTDEGGILTAPHFRVQAQKLVYTRNLDCDPPVFTVQCEDNLLIDYRQWTLVGDYLYYDFITHTGFLINGKTAQPPWYVGGEEILLLDSGNLTALNSYLTTSEGGKPDIVIRSPTITLTPNKVVTADNINVWASKLPLFWFPKVKLDLDNRGRSPFAVKFGWGGFLGSHLSLLYRFLSWGDLKAVARLDGFFGHGLGGGIETRYNPKHRPTEFYTRSYYAHDIAIDDPNDRDRYRLQGTFYDCINGISIDGMYDYVSDAEMAADFYIQDFDLPTAGRTQVAFRKQETSWIANLFSRVRVNQFQSVNQELPTLVFNLHPFEIPYTGILFENTTRGGYLNYVFSEDINRDDFHAGRIFTYPHFYRPFFFGPCTVTPEAGFIGIAYTNSPGGASAGQAIGELGVRFNTSLSRCGPNYKHVIEPYLHYRYLTQPRVADDHHFIFTLDDGYDRLNLMRFGVANSLFVKAPCGIARPLWIDLWTNAFFNEKTIPQAIPKAYLDIEWQPYERIFIGMDTGWNFRDKLVDYYNARLDWTLSAHLAFSLEYRHRSPFDWRKADFYNFILETVRTQEELENSVLSDRRDTFLFRTFIRFTPDWTGKFDMRHGWNRERQDPYLEFQAELGTVLYKHWHFKFIYEKREADDNRFSVSLKLEPGPPPKKRC
ncbi:MAG: hypothetical protein S4CHLAM2_03150 [Chlamydiales bacterium]|nr:hypothetical protein [Chlamydiales bacterium]